MPTISMFYGVLIKLFYKDVEKHHTPHIHAEYQEFVASYSILDGTEFMGIFPVGKNIIDGKKPYPIKGLE